MGTHAKYAPSALERIMACSGSIRMFEGLDCREYEEGIQGTNLHEAVVSRNLDGLTAEEAELVTSCLEKLEEIGGLDGWSHEMRLSVLTPDFEELTFGTMDAVRVDGDIVTIIDWKFGFNPVTVAPENPQLKTYALAAMQRYGARKVRAIIYQPRLRSMSEANWWAHDLRIWLKQLQQIIAKAEGDGTELHSGGHCAYCPAMHVCPEYRRQATALAETHSSEILDPQQMGAALDLARMAERWVDSVRYHARLMLERGQDIPNWSLKPRNGAIYISNPDAAYQALVVNGPMEHTSFMSYVEITAGGLAERYARIKKQHGDATLKDARSEFASFPFVGRRSDTFALTRATARQDNHKQQEEKAA